MRPAAPTAAELALRAAIIDVQHRYALGIDTRNWELYRSVFAEQVRFDFTDWFGGAAEELAADEWVARICAGISGFDGTQHQISNHVVTPHGDGVTCLSYIVARHYLRIDETHHVQAVGGYYTNEFIIERGEWRIDQCRLSVLWTEGDRALFDIAAQHWAARGTHP